MKTGIFFSLEDFGVRIPKLSYFAALLPKLTLKVYSIEIFLIILAMFLAGCGSPQKEKLSKAEQWKQLYEQRGLENLLSRMQSSLGENQLLYKNQNRLNRLSRFSRKISEKDNKKLAAYHRELLRSGSINKLLREIEKLKRDNNISMKSTQNRRHLRLFSHLGLGNFYKKRCVRLRYSESCFEKIRPDNDHLKRAEKAFKVMIESGFDSLIWRWLLNQMALSTGNYENSRQESWWIPGLRREDSSIRFVDRAKSMESDRWSLAGGVAVEDFSNNGRLDIFTSSHSLNSNIVLYKNQEGKQFNKTVFESLKGGIQLSHADYNNDGNLDLFISRGGAPRYRNRLPNTLLKNTGDGQFRDVTLKAELVGFRPTSVALWADYNRDGLVDLFIGNRNKDAKYESRLYKNMGDGRFKNVSPLVGLNLDADVLGASWGDINNDGYPDLYVTTANGRNYLYFNRGNNKRRFFVEVARRLGEGLGKTRTEGLTRPVDAYATWFFDFNNDGFQDIFAGGYKFPPSEGTQSLASEYVPGDTVDTQYRAVGSELYRNNKNLTFSKVTDEIGLDTGYYVLGGAAGDFENDGYPELFLGTGTPSMKSLVPNQFFLNRSGENFVNSVHKSNVGNLFKSKASAVGDINNDGKLEFYSNTGGFYPGDTAPNNYYSNTKSGGNWLNLRLNGTSSNRFALGSRVKAHVENSNGISRTIYDSNWGGANGGSSLRIHLGLGKAVSVSSVKVFWPGGSPRTQIFNDLRVNRHYRLVQGDTEPELLPK